MSVRCNIFLEGHFFLPFFFFLPKHKYAKNESRNTAEEVSVQKSVCRFCFGEIKLRSGRGKRSPRSAAFSPQEFPACTRQADGGFVFEEEEVLGS